ncbi:signal peptidase II [Rubellicoccus peritrichatus]|uniref:Lipoprotein signal peptidase n=1 Tax=Rubellicoccus peritrichatus TaxID=3080537 RepID=A0AAQ3QXB2_9BACT|nr:signal peptidase II [Puniceicoccus sp. CR14]WOO42857.1 signal peptidase II [Puniceicoccus sp. CR14]
MPKCGCNLGYLRLLVTAAIVLVLDQVSKTWIAANIDFGTYQVGYTQPPYTVIENFFYIVHIGNEGAAWGIMQGYGFWLGILGILAVIGIFVFRKHFGLDRTVLQYSFGLLIGGILGNVIDRFRFGHVVDFLDFHFGTYRYPSFNVADAGITVGVAIYLIVGLIDWRNEKKALREK